jgi:hypothetical protein
MDWKLDKQKKDRNMAFARAESVRNINLLEEMDREFEKIFGKSRNAVIAPGGAKAGDPVRRSELAMQGNIRKGN